MCLYYVLKNGLETIFSEKGNGLGLCLLGFGLVNTFKSGMKVTTRRVTGFLTWLQVTKTTCPLTLCTDGTTGEYEWRVPPRKLPGWNRARRRWNRRRAGGMEGWKLWKQWRPLRSSGNARRSTWNPSACDETLPLYRSSIRRRMIDDRRRDAGDLSPRRGAGCDFRDAFGFPRSSQRQVSLPVVSLSGAHAPILLVSSHGRPLSRGRAGANLVDQSRGCWVLGSADRESTSVGYHTLRGSPLWGLC